MEKSFFSVQFQNAFALACELHGTQTRKGTEIPYLSHLLAVTSIVLEDGGNEEEAIAALLHDAVEDQGGRTTLARIRSDFGDEVAAIVDACSDADTQPKPPWRERKEAYLLHLSHEVRPGVLRVSAADKLHNARCRRRALSWAARSAMAKASQSVLLRDLWVQGNDALPSYRGGNTCASPGLGEGTEVWKPSVSRPSCSSVRVTRKARKILASADPMTSNSEHVAANAS